MKLNLMERWVVNNPFRVMVQQIEMKCFKAMMPRQPGFTALEIGCGRGAGARLILRKFRPSQLHILDLDIKMIRMAKTFLSDVTPNRVNMYVGDSINLPFKTGTVDAVFGYGFLHHVPNWRQALSEIARVLKPGGTYYIEELYPELYQNFITKRLLVHPEHDRFGSEDLKTALEEIDLPFTKTYELKKIWIVGTAVKAELPLESDQMSVIGNQ